MDGTAGLGWGGEGRVEDRPGVWPGSHSPGLGGRGGPILDVDAHLKQPRGQLDKPWGLRTARLKGDPWCWRGGASREGPGTNTAGRTRGRERRCQGGWLLSSVTATSVAVSGSSAGPGAQLRGSRWRRSSPRDGRAGCSVGARSVPGGSAQDSSGEELWADAQASPPHRAWGGQASGSLHGSTSSWELQVAGRPLPSPHLGWLGEPTAGLPARHLPPSPLPPPGRQSCGLVSGSSGQGSGQGSHLQVNPWASCRQTLGSRGPVSTVLQVWPCRHRQRQVSSADAPRDQSQAWGPRAC